MSLFKKVNKVLKFLAYEKKQDTETDKNDFVHSFFTETPLDNSSTEDVRKLGTLLFQLHSKISVLVEKIADLDSQIAHLSATQEELLYAFEQQAYEFEQQEDKMVNVELNSKEKKYGTN